MTYPQTSPSAAAAVVMELRAGEGGEDARLFCADLLRMYERYSKKRGWQFELLEAKGDGRGLRLAVCEIAGRGVHALHAEAGAHSIQHITRSRKKDRIHTSNASIVVFDSEELKVAERMVSAGEVRIDTFRGSGAGGQHRNVTDSAVRAVHVPTGETVTITSGRSQIKNRQAALAVLSGRVRARDREQARRGVDSRRAAQAKAGRAQTTRVYDLVRDMVRCERTGRKVRRVRRVLDGDLGQLVS